MEDAAGLVRIVSEMNICTERKITNTQYLSIHFNNFCEHLRQKSSPSRLLTECRPTESCYRFGLIVPTFGPVAKWFEHIDYASTG